MITEILPFSLLLGSCAHNTDSHTVKTSDTGDVSHLIEVPVQNPTGWKATVTPYAIHDDQSSGVFTLGDPIALLYSSRIDKTKLPPDKTAAGTFMTLNSKDGSVHWARTLEPSFSENCLCSNDDMPQTRFEQDQEGDQKFITTSLNGRYPAIQPLPYITSKNPRSFSNQHTHTIVLDIETGNGVRTVKATEVVPGHTLTNDSLAIETTGNFYPVDIGKFNAFSFTNPQEKPGNICTNRWLAGATSESLLLAQQGPRGTYQDLICILATLSTVDEEKDAIMGVAAAYPGGRIERLKDPETAATIFQRDVSAASKET